MLSPRQRGEQEREGFYHLELFEGVTVGVGCRFVAQFDVGARVPGSLPDESGSPLRPRCAGRGGDPGAELRTDGMGSDPLPPVLRIAGVPLAAVHDRVLGIGQTRRTVAFESLGELMGSVEIIVQQSDPRRDRGTGGVGW